MRVAVYNRWLHTMGGGERHSCVAASVLAGAHSVDLVTHRAVDLGELASRLNVDLSKVDLKVIPALPPNSFVQFTRDYDLFVNASFMSSQPSQARRSIMLVLFPSPVDLSLLAGFRRAVGLFLTDLLLRPEYLDGFYDVQEVGRGWFRYVSDQAIVRVHLPRRMRARHVDIICGNFRPPGLGAIAATCSIAGRDVGEITMEPEEGAYRRWRISIPRDIKLNATVDLHIRSDVYNPEADLGEDDNRNIGLAIADVAAPTLRHRLHEAVFRRLFPRLGLRLEGLPDYGSLDFLELYQLVCPISEFSLRWMRHYWNREGPILYPPVAVGDYHAAEKEPIILSVGRFFGAGGHPKMHNFMVRVFGEMVRGGLQGWVLHLAGNRGSRPIDRKYFEDLERETQGLPVDLHPDLSFGDLRDLYSRSSIYWHASGYGQNPTKNPVNFEHFGITTVEAMASGCVPVVINSGGQPELVSHGDDGLLWDDRDGLIKNTLDLIQRPDLLKRLSDNAIVSAGRFSEDRFRTRLLELVNSLN